ncbi:hypothetical protein JCM1840_000217 [Sporobolomyces johnsonii]
MLPEQATQLQLSQSVRRKGSSLTPPPLSLTDPRHSLSSRCRFCLAEEFSALSAAAFGLPSVSSAQSVSSPLQRFALPSSCVFDAPLPATTRRAYPFLPTGRSVPPSPS